MKKNNKIKSLIDKKSNDDDKGRFYNMIVHEVRSQIGIVSNLSEMLLDDRLIQSHDFYKKALKQTCDRIVSLTQDFLEFEQFKKNKIRLKSSAIDLTEFLEVFSMPYVKMAGDKGLLLKLLIEPKCPKYINADVSRLGQILSNLVENAIKYTDEGQVQIHVHYDASQDIGLHFDVIDTGIGLDAGKRNQIFNAYMRLDNALDKQGVGLGLWIVKKLVALMDGRIEVKLDHPKNRVSGSCFRLSLPQDYDEKRVSKAVDVEVPRVVSNKSFGKLPYLLVEDNKLNKHIISTILKSGDVEFDVASSILEARYLIGLRDYRLILLDLNLPDGRGEGLVKEFKDNNFIALTAEVQDNLEKNLKEQGFKGLIQKPIIIKDFFSTIYGILETVDGEV
ncbi:MAG: response regulator [Rhizobiales bacterium]|nr:response regulator [Hyphomicrobiales bacterium]